MELGLGLELELGLELGLGLVKLSAPAMRETEGSDPMLEQSRALVRDRLRLGLGTG